jgi:hypothetical protein
MSPGVRIAVMTVVLVVAAIASLLATISGAIDAVDWAYRTLVACRCTWPARFSLARS